MTTWTEVDHPVLRWVRDQPSSFMPEPWALELGLRRDSKPSEEVAGLTTEQVDQALTRLYGHGLVDGERKETVSYAVWSRLRVTGLGMKLLGEWPDLDQLATVAGLQLLLNEFASTAPNSEDRGALRRLIGVAGQVGEGIALSTLNSAAGDAGAELGGE